MKQEIEETILHYRQRALDLALRYESADVSELQNELRQIMDKRTRVLELGCGSGRDAAFLQKYCNMGSLSAVDASPEILREAARLHPGIAPYLSELVLPHGLESLVRAGERFTGIYSIATLMHLSPEDVTETIRFTDLLLEPAGVLFLSVCSKRPVQPENDHRLFTLKPSKWWRKMLEDTGFRVVDIKTAADGLGRAETSWLNITAVK